MRDERGEMRDSLRDEFPLSWGTFFSHLVTCLLIYQEIRPSCLLNIKCLPHALNIPFGQVNT